MAPLVEQREKLEESKGTHARTDTKTRAALLSDALRLQLAKCTIAETRRRLRACPGREIVVGLVVIRYMCLLGHEASALAALVIAAAIATTASDHRSSCRADPFHVETEGF
jgi:hypothetical protein